MITVDVRWASHLDARLLAAAAVVVLAVTGISAQKDAQRTASGRPLQEQAGCSAGLLLGVVVAVALESHGPRLRFRFSLGK